MRKMLGIAMVLAVALAFNASAVTNAGADKAEKAEKKEGHSCVFHMESMKDAKYEVTNTPDGVTIRITSDKPEVVKQIQECISKCRDAHKSGDHKGMCPMMKDKSKAAPHDEGAEGAHHGEAPESQKK
jgi:hypothetical protein